MSKFIIEEIILQLSTDLLTQDQREIVFIQHSNSSSFWSITIKFY